MTIKLEKLRDKRYAINKKKTNLNPIVAFIQLQELNCDVITSSFSSTWVSSIFMNFSVDGKPLTWALVG
jgi:hypothetical protein